MRHCIGLRPFTSLFVLLIGGLLLLGRPVQADPAARVAGVETYLKRLEKLGFAGSVLIAQGDQTLLAAGYGLADRERERPWTPTTISTIGSITKQFTGAAILALAEEGEVAVEDPITKYFDDVPEDKREITLHQLLTHSSGIVDLEGEGDHDPIEREEFVTRILQQELAFPPGARYEYSNAGYSLLGAIVEMRTGKTYETFLRERFFLPAGMNDTGYVLAGFDPDRLAQGYRDGERWGTVLERPMGEDGPYWVLRANGGIHSTVEDMHRWARHLLAGRALSPESMEVYWSPHVDEGFGDSFYGYGWVVLDAGGTRLITHNGGNGIHFADMAIVPDADLVIVLQCNVVADFPVANQLLEHMGFHLLAGAPLPEVPDPVSRDDAELQAFAGRYELDGGGGLQIEARDGALAITPSDPSAFTALLSTRPADPERAHRLSARLDAIVTAWLGGDVEPLWEAYEGRATREFLEESAADALREWTDSHGDLVGHRVLGTAFRDDRDVTLVRIELERGKIDRAYVWDSEAEEKLLGVSRRGLDPVLHVWPEADGAFASWDARSGASRPLRFDVAEDGSITVRFEDVEGLQARRVGGAGG